MKTYIKDYFFLTLGALIYAFAIEGFLIPSQIIDGGVTGISMILNTFTLLCNYQRFSEFFIIPNRNSVPIKK